METALPGKTRSPEGPWKLSKWAELCQTVKWLVSLAPHLQELCAPDVSGASRCLMNIFRAAVTLWLLSVHPS